MTKGETVRAVRDAIEEARKDKAKILSYLAEQGMEVKRNIFNLERELLNSYNLVSPEEEGEEVTDEWVDWINGMLMRGIGEGEV